METPLRVLTEQRCVWLQGWSDSEGGNFRLCDDGGGRWGGVGEMEWRGGCYAPRSEMGDVNGRLETVSALWSITGKESGDGLSPMDSAHPYRNQFTP